MPSPRNVGPNSAVLRGIGNFANASRGAPDSVYSMYDSPSAFVDVVEEGAELRAGELGGRVGHRLHRLFQVELAAIAVPTRFSVSSVRSSSRSAARVLLLLARVSRVRSSVSTRTSSSRALNGLTR